MPSTLSLSSVFNLLGYVYDSSISHNDLCGPYLPNIRTYTASHIRGSQSHMNEHAVVSRVGDYRKAASKVHPKVQKGLFLFAVSNSCMDPIVYGMYQIAAWIQLFTVCVK